MNKLVRVLCAILTILLLLNSTVLVQNQATALSETQLNNFAQNGILFYDPDETSNGENCVSSSNGIWKGEQYSLSEAELQSIARAVANSGPCNLTAAKNEISLIANVYEANDKYPSILDFLKNGSYFTESQKAALNNTGGNAPEDYVKAAKDILVNGNRTLPQEIQKHDSIDSLDWIEVDGVKHDGASVSLGDKSLYISQKTKVHNVNGDTYIFYQWAGGAESDCGDLLGYLEGNPPSESYSNVVGTNQNYAGVQVFSDADMQTIENNKAIYKEAADKYNFPWQVLAILHNLETGLRRYNPSNGQGVYQLYSYTGGGNNANRFEPADSISEEEFRRQTIIAAGEVSKMVGDLNNTDNIKRLFFQYNGVAQRYIDKAIALGFSEEKAQNGEGSPYVMNRYDAARDPTSASMNPSWPGRFVADGEYDPSATMSGFGAFVQYEALAGTGTCSAKSNNIAEVAINISWEGKNSHPMDDPKPEYVEAMKATGVWGSLRGYPPEGASCDRFVSTVMRYSGADPNFPLGAVSTQEDYMKSHSEMYQKIEHHNDYSTLEPGDIFISYAEHIYLYVGEINGELTQASASYGDRTGEHFPSVYFSDNYGVNGTRYYNVYRRINY